MIKLPCQSSNIRFFSHRKFWSDWVGDLNLYWAHSPLCDFLLYVCFMQRLNISLRSLLFDSLDGLWIWSVLYSLKQQGQTNKIYLKILTCDPSYFKVDCMEKLPSCYYIISYFLTIFFTSIFFAKLLNFNSNYILEINGLLNQFGGVGFHVK